jgi:hypothetical protein
MIIRPNLSGPKYNASSIRALSLQKNRLSFSFLYIPRYHNRRIYLQPTNIVCIYSSVDRWTYVAVYSSVKKIILTVYFSLPACCTIVAFGKFGLFSHRHRPPARHREVGHLRLSATASTEGGFFIWLNLGLNLGVYVRISLGLNLTWNLGRLGLNFKFRLFKF